MLNRYSAVRHLGAVALCCAALLTRAQALRPVALPATTLAPDGTPALIRLGGLEPMANGAARVAGDSRQVLRQQLALGANDDMRPLRIETDPLGYTHERYQQYYLGVKVEHGQYSVHRRGAVFEILSGELKRTSGSPNVRPGLTAAAARQKALAAVGATRYMWQDPAEEQALRQLTGDATATYFPKGELVLVNDYRQGGPNPPLVLAWKFDIYAAAPLSRDWVYVDAHTGRVVFTDAIIKHTTPAGTFQTRYSGTQTSTTEAVTGGFRLRDNTRGLGIQTFNLQTRTNYATGIDFIDADNNWTAAEYDNAASDNAALDAQYGAQATYDYWLTQFGRNSFDNAGSPILSYVHYNVGYDNAFWNGMAVTFGDGSRRYQPLTSLDVCAHEIGHALCQHTAGLVYENETGALNEGLSDIWGACVEYFKAPTKQTWLIGEDITKSTVALRSMSNPNQLSQPDTYQGSRWVASTTSPSASNDYGGVHINSGVLNYWFYLLSAGGAGTNDKGTAFGVSGIGIAKAAQIVYRTECQYLTRTANYAAMRDASLQAAYDLYGAASAEVAAVANAWNAVGLNESAPTLASLSLTAGPVGSTVTLTGTNLLTTTGVRFNGVTATSYVVNSATSITVLVPAGATSGAVSVTTPSGTATAASFAVTSSGVAPFVRAFLPAAGQPVGGSLTIRGAGFTGTTSVTVNGVAWPFAVQHDTSIVAQVPAGATGGALRVTSAGGIGTARSRCNLPPALTRFSPATAVVGAPVRLLGTSFTGATAVRFNGVTAAFVVSSDSVITVNVPVGAVGGPIAVVTSDGVGASTGSFGLTASAAPTIRTFAPTSGGPNQAVTISGRDFYGATSVTFGGAAAGTYWITSDSTIRAIVPLVAGSGTIRVIGPGGTATSAGSFTVTAPVCGLSVKAGPAAPVACAANNQTVALTATVQGAAQVPTYSVAPIAFAPLGIVGRGGPAGDNGVTAELPIGFTFSFFGRDYTSFYLSTNGNIQFDGPPSTSAYLSTSGSDSLTAGTGVTHNFIALAWSNWNRAVGGTITYYTTGTAPNRKLVVSFTNVPHFSGGASLNAQAVLYEGSNLIDLIYTNVGPMAPWALAGVENATGTELVTIPGRNNTYWRATNEAWRFTPASKPGPVRFAWTGPGLIGQQGATATVQVSSPTYFRVTATDSLGSRTDSVLVGTQVAAPSAAGATRCGAGAVTLTAAGAPTDGDYQWYDAAGTPIPGANGVSFRTPALTVTTTYSVAARSASGCESPGRASAMATIQPAPAVPVIAAAAGTLLLNQSTTLTISNPEANVSYAWIGSGLSATTGVSVTATPTALGTATYSVLATGPNGCATGAAPVNLTVLMMGAPTIASFSPTTAVTGTTVTITGTNLNFATQVTFGGVAVSSFTVVSPTSLTVVVPVTALSGTISVTTLAGTVTTAGTFKVRPTISSFTATGGAPGDVITIVGSGFTGATSLKFGTVTTTTLTVLNATTLQATVPPLATTGKLTVSAPGGSATSATNFTVAPIITSFLPTRGAPGSIVLVQGLNFVNGTTVRINGLAAATTFNSSQQLTAVVPGSASSGKISVTSTVGPAAESINFTVVSGTIPSITSYAPTANVVAGTSITITGTNFTGANLVRFNNANATSFTVNSATQITALVPSGATTGRLYVATPSGMTQSAGNLSIVQPPTLTSLSNAGGAPGSVVLLGGTNLSGATAVTLNGAPVSFSINSSAQLVATIPADATTGKFAVTTVAGTATSAGTFTVNGGPAPTITAITPAMGVRGSTVVVAGTHLTGEVAVQIGSTVVTSFVLSSANQLTFTVPTTASSNRIYVTTAGGMAQSPGTYTVILAPTITSFSPATAPVGTLVTINGTNFTGTTNVRFGDATTTSFTVVSATRITVNVPTGATSGALQVTNPAGTATAASQFTVTGTRPASAGRISVPAEPLRFDLYPNPAREQLRVEISNPPTDQPLPPVTLYDALNRLVRRVELTDRIGTLPLHDLAPGTYTVRIGPAVRRLLVE